MDSNQRLSTNHSIINPWTNWNQNGGGEKRKGATERKLTVSHTLKPKHQGQQDIWMSCRSKDSGQRVETRAAVCPLFCHHAPGQTKHRAVHVCRGRCGEEMQTHWIIGHNGLGPAQFCPCRANGLAYFCAVLCFNMHFVLPQHSQRCSSVKMSFEFLPFQVAGFITSNLFLLNAFEQIFIFGLELFLFCCATVSGRVDFEQCNGVISEPHNLEAFIPLCVR